MTLSRFSRTVVAIAVGATLFASSAAGAWPRYHHRWHHHHHHHYRMRYHHMSSPSTNYGTYPNIAYFNMNDHVYARDRATGFTYLVR